MVKLRMLRIWVLPVVLAILHCRCDWVFMGFNSEWRVSGSSYWKLARQDNLVELRAKYNLFKPSNIAMAANRAESNKLCLKCYQATFVLHIHDWEKKEITWKLLEAKGSKHCYRCCHRSYETLFQGISWAIMCTKMLRLAKGMCDVRINPVMKIVPCGC